MDFECEVDVMVKDMFGLDLRIPIYQRPYKWTEKNISELFFDILKAKEENEKKEEKDKLESYRIGTIILHKKNEDDDKEYYNIVDGQQRIISLCLLLNILYKLLKILDDSKDLKVIEDSEGITRYNICKNKTKLEKLVTSELKPDQAKKEYLKYIQDECGFVKIVITSESEELAFQFFDSQNNRGKELELYDTLKAYHLRNIPDSNNYDKNTAVEKWEEAERLSPLFESLYQIKQWSKSKNGNRSKWKMDDKDRFFEIFKGIRNNNDEYPFKNYHLSAREFRQIDMPIIPGEYFFEDIFYYLELYEKIEHLCKENFETEFKNLGKLKNSREGKFLRFKNSGDKYIYDMMKCALLFLAVKFGIENIKKRSLVKRIFNWAWILRVCYGRISKETINNYARGIKSNLDRNLKLFEIIGDKTEIKQILEEELPKPKTIENREDELYRYIFEEE